MKYGRCKHEVNAGFKIKRTFNYVTHMIKVNQQGCRLKKNEFPKVRCKVHIKLHQKRKL